MPISIPMKNQLTRERISSGWRPQSPSSKQLSNLIQIIPMLSNIFLSANKSWMKKSVREDFRLKNNLLIEMKRENEKRGRETILMRMTLGIVNSNECSRKIAKKNKKRKKEKKKDKSKKKDKKRKKVGKKEKKHRSKRHKSDYNDNSGSEISSSSPSP